MGTNYMCVYHGCSKYQKRDRHLTFFQFPIKKSNIIEQWKINSGNTEITDIELLKRRFICSSHFRKEDIYSNSMRKLLRANAIPIDWKDLLQSQNQQKSPDSTPTHDSYGLQPNKDRGSESSSKRKRENVLDSRKSEPQPSTSQTSKEVDRPMILTETYISYKQKYNELLVAYNNLELELLQLKNNTTQTTGTFDVVPLSSTTVKRKKLNQAQIGHSNEEIAQLAKQWTDEFSELRADQQIYAREAISEIFKAAKMNNLNPKSVKINDDCANIVSVKTGETEIDMFDEHLSSTIEDFHCASVKTEDTSKIIYDDNDLPSTSVNSDFRISVKTENTETDYDSISVKTEETDDIYDEENDRCGHYKPVSLISDCVDLSVKSEVAELYEDNSDMIDNQCVLKIEEDCSNYIPTMVKVGDYNEDVLNVDAFKVEKDQVP